MEFDGEEGEPLGARTWDLDHAGADDPWRGKRFLTARPPRAGRPRRKVWIVVASVASALVGVCLQAVPGPVALASGTTFWLYSPADQCSQPCTLVATQPNSGQHHFTFGSTLSSPIWSETTSTPFAQ